MAKNKVIGVIAALVIAGGLAAGGYYYNDHVVSQKVQQDRIIGEQAVAAQTSSQATTQTSTQTEAVKQVKTADDQIVKVDDQQEKKEQADVNQDEQTATKDADQAKVAQDNAKKAEATVQKDQEVVNKDQAKNDSTKATTEQTTVQKTEQQVKQDEATAKVDQAKAQAAAQAEQIAKDKVAKDQAAAKAEAAQASKVTSATVAVGPTNTAIVPNGNIIQSAKAYAVPANEVNQMVNGKYPGNQKEIFLTFDDGPSVTNTPKILNTLKKYGVHATFFVLGSELQSQASKNVIKEEIMDGNAIADHSYSHSYTKLYPGNTVNVSAFMNEFNATNDILRSVLGKNFNARVVRMPGGYMSRVYYHDKNLPALNAAFNEAGIASVDWNAETGDATGRAYSPSELVQNAEKETKGYDHIVLLMHDIKSNTAAALPQLIEYYKSHGYAFKVISNTGIN
ncbi:MAG: polysaccharide deacetylase family protein [Sarcina sp.]